MTGWCHTPYVLHFITWHVAICTSPLRQGPSLHHYYIRTCTAFSEPKLRYPYDVKLKNLTFEVILAEPTCRHAFEAGSRPRLLALDCEMCATAQDSSALLGVCLVDEEGGIVYRELIKPEGEILDLRTEVTGERSGATQGSFSMRLLTLWRI